MMAKMDKQRFGAALLGVALCAGMMPQAAAAERRAFVFNWFYAGVYTQDDSCPEGINPLSNGILRNALTLAGKSDEETTSIVESVVAGAGARDAREARNAIIQRGRVQGKPANVYLNPLSAADPGFKTAVGRYAYGFNLDGKGAGKAGTFEDPETAEKGVDNAYYRVIGCIENHQAPPGTDPVYPISTWDTLRESMPAWVLTVEGKDLSRDGDVTVTFDRAINTAMRDAHGEVLVDQTFQVDPDPRSHHVFTGKIKNGVLTAKVPSLYILGDEFLGYELDFTRVQLRLNFKEDRSAEGLLGGYVKWMPLYVQHAGAGITAESMRGIDVIGLYRAYLKLADAEPDATGQNTRLSSAWRVKLLPAFVIPPDAQQSQARIDGGRK